MNDKPITVRVKVEPYTPQVIVPVIKVEGLGQPQTRTVRVTVNEAPSKL